jgi:uncharacterized protein
MKKLVSFFEIPADDFERAVEFYEKVFDLKLHVEACSDEKMGFFPGGEGAVSKAEGFKPSADGVLISLAVESIEQILALVVANRGSISIPKTAILANDMGWFAVFKDTEGNRIGLHQKS